jgi:hypothetical protein
MPVDSPVSDLERSLQHEQDRSWPTSVKVQLMWLVDGRPSIRTLVISADQFFGTGNSGAPLEGMALIGMIENMRRSGPPPVERSPRSGKKKKR